MTGAPPGRGKPLGTPSQKTENLTKMASTPQEDQRFKRIVVFNMPDEEVEEVITIEGIDRGIAQHEAAITELKDLKTRMQAVP